MRKVRTSESLDVHGRQELIPPHSQDIAHRFSRELTPNTQHQHSTPMHHSDEMGNHAIGGMLPTGQNLNVVTNHNVHLSRREWVFRGLVGALGMAAAWPFKLIADLISQVLGGIISAILGFFKVALIIIAIPTLLWLGIMLMNQLQSAESVEEGTAMVVDHAGSFADGVNKGIAE